MLKHNIYGELYRDSVFFKQKFIVSSDWYNINNNLNT